MAKKNKNKTKGNQEERSAGSQPNVLEGNAPQSQEDASYTGANKKN